MRMILTLKKLSAKLRASVKNEDGMTLVEVMVTSAIMMVLALAMTTFMKNSQDQGRAVETKSNYNSMGNSVRSISSQGGAVLNTISVTD